MWAAGGDDRRDSVAEPGLDLAAQARPRAEALACPWN